MKKLNKMKIEEYEKTSLELFLDFKTLVLETIFKT